jgi:arsenite methyltransferase
MSEELKGQVRRRYAEAALAVRGMGGGDDKTSCCGPSCCGTESQASKGDNKASCCGPSCCSLTSEASKVDMTGGSYSPGELGELPETAAAASLGCGNPVALATLSPGEVVLDLGSGGGIDVLLSAQGRPAGGKAYGLDMTDEMLSLAPEPARGRGGERGVSQGGDRG